MATGREPSAWGTLLGLVVLAASVAHADPRPVKVVVESPRPGQVVRARMDMAPLEGVARSGAGPSHFDVMLVLDVSGSTEFPSGSDVDRDGEVGVQLSQDVHNSDPQDSVLAAEVAAARALLEDLDPARVRVGVLTFSGEFRPDTGRRVSLQQQDAQLEVPLTQDYAAVERALAAVLARGSHGGTNMEAGIKGALWELAGLEGAQSQPTPGAKSVILMLTDGKPSLPFGSAQHQDEEDIEAALAAARLAREAGVIVNVYGLGPGAIDYPVAVTRIAEITNGLYTPVRRPGDIVSMLNGISFADVDAVVAMNLTLGEMAGDDDILLAPDGSFRGFVPVRPGRNRIRVSAVASDGARGSAEFEITFEHEDLTDAELEAERERIRERNRELQLLIERRRQEAFRKAERKRMLELEVEDEDENRDDEEKSP